MEGTKIELGTPLASLLRGLGHPLEVTAKELIVLELYRRGTISSGRAGELLGLSKADFLQHALRLGIPHLDMTAAEWEQEVGELRKP